MARASGKSGFSLVELLVAVTIMLVLAGVMAVNIAKDPGRARVARAKSDIATLKTALRLYQSDNFTLPTQRQGLEALVTRPVTEPVPKNWRDGGYIDSSAMPRDPWGNEYIYFVPGRAREAFEIVSYGADGQPGGEDEAADISSSAL